MEEDKAYAGIVSVKNRIAMHNGEKYRYVWCSEWRMKRDPLMPIEAPGLSSESWQLIAYYENQPVLIIPSSQIVGFAIYDEQPTLKHIFSIDLWMTTE